jgi:IMP dehydrogenase/GMP reductase
VAQSAINTASAPPKAPAKAVASKNGTNPNFGMNMPMMTSAFDTAAWLNAA